MRTAVIDLGTNTFDLIIVEQLQGNNPPFKTIHTDKSFVHLGAGGINEEKITKEAMERARFALSHFMQACRDCDVEPRDIYAFGTSALRDAENADEFQQFVNAQFGFQVSIIPGNEEARLIYEGVKGIHNYTSLSCIMDIGGGSTEFIFADAEKVRQIESLNIGISRMLQLFDAPGKLDTQIIDKLISYMDESAGELFSRHEAPTLIGAAGSFETYFQLVSEKTSYDDFSTHEIPMEKLEQVLDYLINSSLEERTSNFWIPNYRRNMIHIAAVQTQWVIDRQKIRRCFFSPAALKEGVLFSSI